MPGNLKGLKGGEVPPAGAGGDGVHDLGWVGSFCFIGFFPFGVVVF